jgi:hypothetical protein
MSERSVTEAMSDAPATLHRVMQAMIADGLRTRYEPPQKLSHELFVLLMQINEQDRRNKAQQRPDSHL